MDEDVGGHECQICCDSYTEPKLLKCGHTFCTACLEKYLKSGGEAEILQCPVCRSNVPIPKNGIAGFMDNFFVQNRESKKNVRIKSDTCNQNNSSAIKVCPDSKKNICLSCSATITSTEGDTEDEDERRSQDNCNLYSVAISVDSIRYRKVLGMMSRFSLDFIPDKDEKDMKTRMSPVSDTECWVASSCRPEIFRYDILGNIKEHITIRDDFVTSIEYRKDEILLIATFMSSQILKYFAGQITSFASTNDLRPYDLSSFPDGRIVVVGKEKMKEGQKIDELCAGLQLLDPDGNMLAQFIGKYNQTPLKDPVSVSVNKHSLIFVCDREEHCVFIFSDKGEVLNKYLGGRVGIPTAYFTIESLFQPICVCADTEGNVIVNDNSLGTLHLLDSNGNFIGLALANQPEEYGQPFCVAIDNRDKIWLGDKTDKKIRVYECIAFVNHLDYDKVKHLQFPLQVYIPHH
ncbi:hypothetical protein KUTeg_021802 [Tegillarca granosa]|uniref:RING-type domain-containing protein n=1 Tax=Tegillarca granosa TaxID=220873 RepID=A0ABQ9EAK7_TEGGR|nr:hypothetical protein KUTeg_021802 [Tegillarca granosa]